MRDPDFQEFINEFGEGACRTDVDDATIEQWRGRLPGQLLDYWKQEGWCSYGDGLFWTIDPQPYEDVVQAWLEDTPLAGRDTYHAIARTAFGDLFLCGERTGPVITLSGVLHTLNVLPDELKAKSKDDLDFEIRDFFGGSMKEYCDIEGEDDKPLFKRALRKLGPLRADEAYGFEPAPSLGGSLDLAHLRKVKTVQYLLMLRELEAPSLPFSQAELARFDKILGSD